MKIAEIIRLIRRGIDPTTGEVFDTSMLSSNPELRNEISKLALTAFNGSRVSKPEPLNALNRDSNMLFDQLKDWRLNTAMELGVPAYVVFTDQELWNIAEGDICSKEELLFVKGISDKRFELYGDELFDIIRDYIEFSNKLSIFILFPFSTIARRLFLTLKRLGFFC